MCDELCAELCVRCMCELVCAMICQMIPWDACYICCDTQHCDCNCCCCCCCCCTGGSGNDNRPDLLNYAQNEDTPSTSIISSDTESSSGGPFSVMSVNNYPVSREIERQRQMVITEQPPAYNDVCPDLPTYGSIQIIRTQELEEHI